LLCGSATSAEVSTQQMPLGQPATVARHRLAGPELDSGLAGLFWIIRFRSLRGSAQPRDCGVEDAL